MSIIADIVESENHLRTLTVVAVDRSGSTDGLAQYWERVANVLKSFGQPDQTTPKDKPAQCPASWRSRLSTGRKGCSSKTEESRSNTDHVKLVLWNTEAEMVTAEEMWSHVQHRHGHGGTRLSSLCHFLQRYNINPFE